MFDPMEKPVQLGGPSSSIRIVEHALEVLKGIFVGFLHCQSFPERIHTCHIHRYSSLPDVSNVIDTL